MNAVFELAYGPMRKKEGIGSGGYGNRERDRGGETFNGISRVKWPAAGVWPIIDRLKQLPGFPGILDAHVELEAATSAFYRANFWEPLGLGWCDDQVIANELFEQAVNLGGGTSARNLQEALNILNTRENNIGKVVQMWPDLKVDGFAGPVTIECLKDCIQANRRDALFGWLNVLQGDDYKRIIQADPSQRVNAAGWVSRIASFQRPE